MPADATARLAPPNRHKARLPSRAINSNTLVKYSHRISRFAKIAMTKSVSHTWKHLSSTRVKHTLSAYADELARIRLLRRVNTGTPFIGVTREKGDWLKGGVPVIYFDPAGLPSLMGWRDWAALNTVLEERLHKFMCRAPLRRPDLVSDSRNHEEAVSERIRELEGERSSHLVGIGHFLCWIATGQARDDVPNANAFSSRDCADGGRALDELAKVCRTMRPLWRAFGQALKLVDPEGWEVARVTVARRVAQTGIGTLIGSDELCWAGFVLLVNAPCGLHVDASDTRLGWVAMTPFGDFRGADLCLPQFDARAPYQPGAICLMRSAMVEHGISRVRGVRYGFVATMHENLA